MLEKKLKQDTDAVKAAMETGEIASTDAGRDIMRNIRGCTSFENTFDRIIEAGKKEVDNETPKNGKKEKVSMPQDRLAGTLVYTCK